jgi:tetratricopeptide (TPR) repeat protein
VPRRGYRFAAPVTWTETRASDAELTAMLQPYRALIDGRAALETLERGALAPALEAFEAAARQSPDAAAPQLGLANALVLRFESTRADAEPDAVALARAGEHAREACRLDPQSGDAWATLALVLHHTREPTEAIAAARRAVALEAENWRHHLRLAYVAWGEERLRAAHKALALFPNFALAHWLAATVYVARGAFDLAERELQAGAAAQDAQRGARAFASVGSHWLLGLVHLARGQEAPAIEAFQRELACETGDQLFARECAANSWYAIGALRLRQQRGADAAAAFEQALARVPAHLLATTGMWLARDDAADRETLQGAISARAGELTRRGRGVDAAIAMAAQAVAGGRSEQAASALAEALDAATDAGAGWTIPVDPLLEVSRHAAAFAHILTRLRTRAG